MLHEVSADGGLGFCHTVLPGVLPAGYHGPLVVALDSNVLIDFQQYGDQLLGDELPDLEEGYAEDLSGLADSLHIWLLRDIRFVVTPTTLVDAKKATQRFLDTRLPTVEAIAHSLAFQVGEWTITPPSYIETPVPVGEETGLPHGPDRDLVLEAQAIGAHAFLTRDQRILKRVALSGPALAVVAPRTLAGELVAAGVRPFFGGTCGEEDCPYGDGSALAGDTGKWAGLLSIFATE
jgi:hypothetical protein